jgi:methyl-accepting chemotaxis protein
MGLGAGIVFTLIYYIEYQQFLFWFGLGHMAILFLFALIVEDRFKSGSGVYVQFAGYIWTLIGVVSILLSFSNNQTTIDLLRNFLYGAGLAVGTSIIGWTLGKWLEDRVHEHDISTADAAADDVARVLIDLKKGLESAGKSLTDAMMDSADNIENLKSEAEKATSVLHDLSGGLKKSADSLDEILETTEEKFKDIIPKVEDFQKNVSQSFDKISESINQFADLSDHTKDVVKNIDELATTIKDSADTVQKATEQSQRVIEQTGLFIDTVFKSGDHREKKK